MIAHVPCESLGYSKAMAKPDNFVAILPKDSEVHTDAIWRTPPSVPQLNVEIEISI